jgi:hypothetical protein
MREIRLLFAALVMALSAPIGLLGQSAQTPPSVSIPRLVSVTGVYQPANGQPPPPGTVVTLLVYAEPQGGTPLWQETQNVEFDVSGHFTLLLGASLADGIPAEVFASGDAKWLALHFAGTGEVEGPRSRITSVPYALRSADADTLGGKPASAYVLADPATSAASAATAQTASTKGYQSATTQSATAGWIPVATDSIGGLGNSSMFQSASNFIGVGTTTPKDTMHAVVNDATGNFTGFAVQNLNPGALAYSGMLFYDHTGALTQFQGYNNNTHEYRINNIASGGTINFMIGGGSKLQVANNGDVVFENSLALRAPNPYSVSLGQNALPNGSGGWNTAVGASSMNQAASLASYNTAIGAYALELSTTSIRNTAVGYGAGYTNTTGDSNIAIGYLAGTIPAASNSNNIEIGNTGVSSDSGTIRIGAPGTQTSYFAAGVRGVTTGAANAVSVVIDSNGQLGTINSSRRYKEDIQDMGDASSRLMQLRPVTYRYKQAYADGGKPIDYGLIAEEVEAVYPDLVAHSKDGEVETVQYQKINAMLLNEVQKQHRTLEEQRQQIETGRTEIELLKARLAALEAQHRQ